jgi:hypothetical protein
MAIYKFRTIPHFKLHLSLIFLAGIFLAACGTVPEPTYLATSAALPTVLVATATPDVYQLTLGKIQAQATLDAMQATSQAISANLTSAALAPTQAAAETATERAWVFTGWTATAAVEQTAVSARGTATQQAWQATATQRVMDLTATVESAAASAQATALHGQAVSVELAVERERMMNTVQAAAPWGALCITFIFVLVVAFRWSKVRPIQRDARGDAPLLVIEGKIYDADRNPYPLVDLSGKKPSIPALTAPEMQAATTARDQMIDLATRGTLGTVAASPQRKALAQQMAAQKILPPPAPVRILSPEQARPLLGDILPGIVRDALETDLNKTEPGETE